MGATFHTLGTHKCRAMIAGFGVCVVIVWRAAVRAALTLRRASSGRRDSRGSSWFESTWTAAKLRTRLVSSLGAAGQRCGGQHVRRAAETTIDEGPASDRWLGERPFGRFCWSPGARLRAGVGRFPRDCCRMCLHHGPKFAVSTNVHGLSLRTIPGAAVIKNFVCAFIELRLSESAAYLAFICED